jgi:hypothetical protein
VVCPTKVTFSRGSVQIQRDVLEISIGRRMDGGAATWQHSRQKAKLDLTLANFRSGHA